VRVRKPAAVKVTIGPTSRRSQTMIVLLLLLGPATGCRNAPVQHVTNLRGDTVATTGEARRITAIDGFYGPESVRYDDEQDVYFVSNMRGEGSAHDGDGYVVRVNAETLTSSVFARGGLNGVTLNAPKGMALQGDTLWVTDIDALRGFHRRTGAPVATIDFKPYKATLLNDVAAGPNGELYVTDTGIIMTDKGVLHPGGDRVFVVGADRSVEVLARGASAAWANGVTWDPERKRWLFVSFDPFRSEVFTLTPDGRRQPIIAGPGRFDGIEVLPDGRMLVTCWNDHSVHLIDGNVSRHLIGGIAQPADLGYDTRRNRVLIPLVIHGRVEIWTFD
jgi:sugar lactone lactonase YvrE